MILSRAIYMCDMQGDIGAACEPVSRFPRRIFVYILKNRPNCCCNEDNRQNWGREACVEKWTKNESSMIEANCTIFYG